MATLTHDEMYALVRRHGAEPDVDWAMVTGAKAESNWNPEAIGDNGHSVGLWQMHDQGLGAGMTVAARADPDTSAAAMLPHYEAAYDQAREEGYTGAERIVRTCCLAEKPYAYQDMHSAAADGYRAAVVPSWPPAEVTMLAYDPTLPPVRQDDNWSCSVCTTTWMLQSLGVEVTEPEMEGRMIQAGLVNPALGLLDGTGAELARWLRSEFQLAVEQQYPMAWDDLTPWCGGGPIGLGGQAWNHWSAARGGDAVGMVLANPAPSWQGVGDHLDKGEWDQLGPWAALYIPAAQGGAPVTGGEDEDDEWEALSADLAACQSAMGALMVDVIRPTVEQMDSELAKPAEAQQWTENVQMWADRLRPYTSP